MKLSICGKGGSGKSTVVALLAGEAAARGYRVLVVDSDESNTGLFQMLGFDQSPTPLMDLVGGKVSLKGKMSQPNVLAEPQIATHDIPQQHVLESNGLKLVTIGKILQSLEGCACPMGVLSREFLKKLSLDSDEIVIVDMEAGVEHFGRGVETSLDSVLIVVEPPLESVRVAEKIHDLAAGTGTKNVWAVLNKIPSEEIGKRLQEKLENMDIDVIGTIHLDDTIFESGMEGTPLQKGKPSEEMGQVLDRILPEEHGCVSAQNTSGG